MPRKTNRASDNQIVDEPSLGHAVAGVPPSDERPLGRRPRPPGPPIVVVVQEELPIGEGAVRLCVSLRMPGGRLVETRVLMAGPDAGNGGLADAALADLAVGWAAALDPALADSAAVVVRG